MRACLAGAAWVIALSAGTGVAAELEPAGQFVWRAPGEDFGGLSDLAVGDAGAGLLALSDRGSIFRARISRAADGGQITEIEVTATMRPEDNFGEPVSGFRQDAEDMAVGPDGRLYVAFESYARITGFDLPDMTAHPTHGWERFRPLWGNEGFEALTTLADGGLAAVIENPDGGAYRTFLWQGGTDWDEGPSIPGADGYQATGADLGPDGQVYLLERSYSLVWGYGTRIRSLTWTGAGSTGG